MAVINSANLKFYLSGGASNTDPNASLGGARSSTLVPANLFDDVTGDQASAGYVDYRCVYFRNEDSNSAGLISAMLWIDAQTPAGDDIAIGLDPAGKNGTATTITNETTAPSGVTFSAPSTKSGGLSLGTLATNDYYAIWIRRNVPASTSAYTGNTFTLKVEGDSQA